LVHYINGLQGQAESALSALPGYLTLKVKYMSKGKYPFKQSDLVRLMEGVTKATGLPVRVVEFNSETKVLKVSVDPPPDYSIAAGVPEDLRKLL
jgi:hypothetical protein